MGELTFGNGFVIYHPDKDEFLHVGAGPQSYAWTKSNTHNVLKFSMNGGDDYAGGFTQLIDIIADNGGDVVDAFIVPVVDGEVQHSERISVKEFMAEYVEKTGLTEVHVTSLAKRYLHRGKESGVPYSFAREIPKHVLGVNNESHR